MLSLLAITLALATLGQSAKLDGLEQRQVTYPQYDVITYCPEDYGLQTYPHPGSCHGFYKCANGTLTEELCEHGLLYDGKGGNVYNNCNYHWGVDCEGRSSDVVPHTSGPCEYDFGIYAAGACETYFTKCEWGQPTDYPCTPGLAYDERTHSCNWADLMLEWCNPSEVVGFKCPDYIDPTSLAAKFIPFPRFPSGDCSSYLICVEGHPRRIGCGDYTVFDETTLTCADPEYVPKCQK